MLFRVGPTLLHRSTTLFENIHQNICKKMIHNNLSSDRFVWMDLEMTGLDPTKDRILEMACIITTPDLEEMDTGINVIIHQPDEVLQAMNEWCIHHHGKTGLTNDSKQSKIHITDAERIIHDYIKRFTNPEGVNYLAGNSVHYDKSFIANYMPSVNGLFHHRIIDVSTLKELWRHWIPKEYSKVPDKKFGHRSMDDIKESIQELKFYRQFICNVAK